jgi:hypothetical protein
MYTRGDVVKAPDPFGGHAGRPYLALSDDNHPFNDEEAIYAAITKTARSDAVPITASDFVSGSLPIDPSYASPWVLVTIKHDDVLNQFGRLDDRTTDRVAGNAGFYVDP